MKDGPVAQAVRALPVAPEANNQRVIDSRKGTGRGRWFKSTPVHQI